MASVPDFFQLETTDARRDQIAFMEAQLGLDRGFFEALGLELGPGGGSLSAALSAEHAALLASLWEMVLHLLSLTRFDTEMAASLLTTSFQQDYAGEPPTAPWLEDSVRSYIEREGASGIEAVSAWLTSFRFADRHRPRAQSVIQLAPHSSAWRR